MFDEEILEQLNANIQQHPRLLHAKDSANASYLHVTCGKVVARPQLRIVNHCLEPLLSLLLKNGLVWRVEEESIGREVGSANPPPQLVELRQAKVIGILYDYGVDGGDVQPTLNDRCAHKHVVLPLCKPNHDMFKVGHTAVSMGDLCFGKQLLQRCGRLQHPLNARQNIVHLAAALQFIGYSLVQESFVIGPSMRMDGLAH
mmetsp:Transcript_12128/g.20601  ORF Transcript_12128/g.20601 Transcript_12128/m.20601 type:complete len:201 (+) Transcript_12128:586-1188(+)